MTSATSRCLAMATVAWIASCASSRPATLRPAEPRDAGTHESPVAGTEVKVVGVLAGGMCHEIRADDGIVYTFRPSRGVSVQGLALGERVIAEGTVATISTCMYGTELALRQVTRAATSAR